MSAHYTEESPFFAAINSSSDKRPLPWEANPSQLFSRWIVIPFAASQTLQLIRILEHAQGFRNFGPSGLQAVISNSSLSSFVTTLKIVSEELNEMGLLNSLDQANRMISRFEEHANSPLKAQEYCELTKNFFERFVDETKRQQFFMVPSHKVKFHLEAAHFFGERVNTNFNSARSDIEQAMKCYAFGRNTASVFHLMRVMEIGLRTLGKSLNEAKLNPKNNPSWETILRRCDDELKKPTADRSGEWKQDGQFFADATANLRAVKDAWRNPTMHVERNYEEDEVLSIITTVKGFMQHLATRLNEGEKSL